MNAAKYRKAVRRRGYDVLALGQADSAVLNLDVTDSNVGLRSAHSSRKTDRTSARGRGECTRKFKKTMRPGGFAVNSLSAAPSDR